MRFLVTFGLMAVMAGAQQAPGGQAIGEMQLTDATVRGAVTLSPAGAALMSGSQVSAGGSAAVIRLARGGELKVCAQSSIAITASASGKETLVGLNGGALETRYRLGANADTIVTPDFRLQLPGPGDFHFAVGMKPNGDMCVKSLVGNSSAMIVNEVFGDGTHQVRPGDAVLFEKGRVAASRALAPGEDCGCVEVKLAEFGRPQQEPQKAPAPVMEAKPLEKPAGKPAELGFPEQQSQKAAAAVAEGKPVEKPAPLPQVTTKENEVITKVDAPIVFRGEDLPPQPKAEPAKAASAPPASAAVLVKEEPKPAAKPKDEPSPPKPVKKRWYQKLGSAIAKIFR